MSNVSMSCLFTQLINMLITIFSLYPASPHRPLLCVPCSRTHCVFNGFLVVTCYVSSLLTLASISFNRYMNVCQNAIYNRYAAIVSSTLYNVVARGVTALSFRSSVSSFRSEKSPSFLLRMSVIIRLFTYY